MNSVETNRYLFHLRTWTYWVKLQHSIVTKNKFGSNWWYCVAMKFVSSYSISEEFSLSFCQHFLEKTFILRLLLHWCQPLLHSSLIVILKLSINSLWMRNWKPRWEFLQFFGISSNSTTTTTATTVVSSVAIIQSGIGLSGTQGILLCEEVEGWEDTFHPSSHESHLIKCLSLYC